MQRTWLEQYPAGVPAEVEVDAPLTLIDLIDAAVRRHPMQPALSWHGRDLAYGRFDLLSRRFAAWLQSQGMARGDRVAVMLPNAPQYPVAAVAILRAGGVVVNVDPQLDARELEHQLRDSGATAIVVAEAWVDRLQPLLEQVPLRGIVVAAPGDLLGALRGALVDQVARRMRRLVPSFRLPGAVRFADAVARGRRLKLPPVAVGPDDIALLQYTGGTTGPARGVVLLHRNLVANVLQSAAWIRPALAQLPPDEQPAVVCALPLHQIYAFGAVMLLGLHLGARLLLVPGRQDVEATLRALARQRFHVLPADEMLLAAVAGHALADRVDWSALRLCVGGGMAVQPATARRWHALTGCPVCEGYGLTEAGPAVSCNPVDLAAYSGDVGLPLPGTEVRLVDDDGVEVAPGTPGEITIRGPQRMAGYWQRPEDTARVVGADGWLRSGDIGVFDAGGRLRWLDRKKDRIVVGGRDVYPAAIEDAVAGMPGVAECAAIGVPDARAGEAVKIVVVRADPAGASPSEDEVHRWCAGRLGERERPRFVEFRADLPRTAVGKVLRRALRGPG